MKRLKIFTIMAAAVISASLYSAPGFAANTNSKMGLELTNVSAQASTNSITGTYKVTNTGSETINLSDVKIRYYYTNDNKKGEEFHCYSANITNQYKDITTYVKGTVVKMESPIENADTYIEISFDSAAGTITPGDTVSIQSALTNSEWSNYNQSNDYSYNKAGNVTVLVNNIVTWGTLPDKGSVTDSKLSETNVVVNKTSLSDININMELNGNTFEGITDLIKDTDYKVNAAGSVVIKQNYLSKLPAGDKILTFNFSKGAAQKLNISVIDSDEIDSLITTTSGVYYKNNKADIDVGMTLNGNTLVDIKNKDVILKAGTDYILNGNIVTLKQAYLDTLVDGQATDLTFNFSKGKSKTFVVTSGQISQNLIAGIGKIEAKPGDTINLPVTLTGTPEAGIANFGYRIKYDPNVVEVVKVEAGTAITNPSVNFVYGVYPDTKIISVIFMDNAMNDTETIKTDGVLTNIQLKIKDTAAKGSTAIEFNNDDHSFYDINGKELKVDFASGSINIK
ncbi:hypothetical protein psyc5s11_39290 [Clostridium gelidum]|uniref:CBM3 domain-containing protein n=1 Tax=Clostridium gelidum TaxID=704125 RepID=A0ABN6J0V1_9CLOT|nr:X2-like carbohydrate binding domain-containing protein [Clostridium gelidum]BCZ47862.1 hypothetical protein psyc5s11_39290 [Clostridium gelidum]